MVNLELFNFLQKYPKTENGKHTHIIYAPSPGKSYTIPNSKMDELYGLLTKSLFVNGDKISIVEKIQTRCRLVVDFDFKYKKKLTNRQYNDNILTKIIQNIFSNIETLYHLSEEQKVCWIMEKDNICDAPQQGYESKDGIHLLFPYIIAEKRTYLKLRELMLESNYHQFFEEEEREPPSNTMDEIIDDAIYKGGNWFIYGSGKPKEDMKYKLTGIKKVSSDTLINLPIDIYLEEPLEIMKNNSVMNHDEINVEYTEYLNNRLKTKTLKTSSSMESVEAVEIHPEIINIAKKHDIDKAKKIVEQCLSVERASNYTDWISVGMCLHTISSTELLPYWIGFSKKWSMWNDSSECEKRWTEWNNSNRNELDMGTLIYWAQIDNPEKEKEINKDSLSTFVWRASSGKKDQPTGAHSDVATVVYHYFKDRFVCANIKDNLWYYFNKNNGGRWEITEVGHELRSKLSSEIVGIFEYYGNIYRQKFSEDQEEEKYDIHHTNCLKVQLKLKDSTYKDKIMKECKEYFYDKNFVEKLDDQKHLIGFENGIYDLNKGVFRGGLPSDYISLSTQLNLPVPKSMIPIGIEDILEIVKEVENYDELNEGLNDFLEKVFPTDGVREYTLRFLSSCLSGEVREEKFYFWTGSGGNGKSKLVDLIELALGDYSRSMDVGYLTTKKGSSSSASPELESIKHARFVWMSEPEKTDTIYVGKLKLMSGGDKMTTRGLYKETTQFKPQFKIILMCNELPKLGGNDGGIWRRIEVVEYISKFTDDPRPSPANPHQYKADEQLTKKLELWNVLFVIKLLDKYRKYNVEGTCPPKEVKDKTKAYRTSNDIIANWIDNDIVECDEFFSFSDLYDAWERWCDEEGYMAKQRPEKKEVKESLLKHQEKTEYGLVLGNKKSDKCPNGTKKYPEFNFKPMED